jgi:hypothetical protein
MDKRKPAGFWPAGESRLFKPYWPVGTAFGSAAGAGAGC